MFSVIIPIIVFLSIACVIHVSTVMVLISVPITVGLALLRHIPSLTVSPRTFSLALLAPYVHVVTSLLPIPTALLPLASPRTFHHQRYHGSHPSAALSKRRFLGLAYHPLILPSSAFMHYLLSPRGSPVRSSSRDAETGLQDMKTTFHQWRYCRHASPMRSLLE